MQRAGVKEEVDIADEDPQPGKPDGENDTTENVAMAVMTQIITIWK